MKITAIIITFLLSINLFAETLLQDVKTYRTDKSFVTELKFNEELKSENILIDYINQTIQVNIPGAKIAKGKRRDQVKDEKVKSIFTYQTDTGLRTRIIYKKPTVAADLEGLFVAGFSNNTLKLTVYNDGQLPLPQKIVALPIIKPFDLNKEMTELTKKPITFKKIKKSNAKLVLDSELNLNKLRLSAVRSKKNIKEKINNESKITAKLKDINNLKESEIPILLNIKSKKEKSGPNHIRAIVSVLLVLSMAFGLYLFSKWWSVKHNKTLGGNQIRVIYQHHLGPKKSLMIVRVAGETLLLGNTEQSINLIKPLALLEEDSLTHLDESKNFSDTLSSSINSNKKVYGNNKLKSQFKNESSADQFSMTKVKSLVGDKLKNMRNI